MGSRPHWTPDRNQAAHTNLAGATPRRGPAVIGAVEEIPRTRSGKTVELAVRDPVCGRPIANIEALANPEALNYFRNCGNTKGWDHDRLIWPTPKF